LFGSMVILLNL